MAPTDITIAKRDFLKSACDGVGVLSSITAAKASPVTDFLVACADVVANCLGAKLAP